MTDKSLPDRMREQGYLIIGVIIGVAATLFYDIFKALPWLRNALAYYKDLQESLLIVVSGALTLAILFGILLIVVRKFEKSRERSQT